MCRYKRGVAYYRERQGQPLQWEQNDSSIPRFSQLTFECWLSASIPPFQQRQKWKHTHDEAEVWRPLCYQPQPLLSLCILTLLWVLLQDILRLCLHRFPGMLRDPGSTCIRQVFPWTYLGRPILVPSRMQRVSDKFSRFRHCYLVSEVFDSPVSAFIGILYRTRQT